MIQVPAQASVFVMVESVSFHKGIDGLAAVARTVLDEEPMSGAIFGHRSFCLTVRRIVGTPWRWSEGGGAW